MAPTRGVLATGPSVLPRIGHLRAFLRDRLGFLSRCAQYGDVVRLEIGTRTYLLTHPDDVRHVLLSNSENYVKSPRLVGTRARRFFGDGVVTVTGPAHQRQRRILQPLFHRASVERFASLMTGSAERMIERWPEGTEIDVHAEMLTLTQGIMMRVLLGEEAESEARFTRAVTLRRRYQEYLLGSVLPFPEYRPTRINRAYRRASRDIDIIIESAVQSRRRTGGADGDLLSMLVQARYEDGTGMSGRQIRDEVRTLALAGYETVAEALTWAWYLLARFPAAEAELAAEAAGIPGERSLVVGDLPRLAYHRMVLAEAMRLYPPSWVFVRVARSGDILPSGVRVPSGTKIYLCPWVMHREARYFPDPERFDPRRFTPTAVQARPKFTYFPFGGGRRLCIGEEFAWMEGVLLLASIARRFRLAVVPGQTIVPDPNVTLRPKHGIRMSLTRR